MLVATLDTNILASAIAGVRLRPSIPGEVFRWWLRDRFRLVTSEHMLAELTSTLSKPYFRVRVDPSRAARFEALIRRRAVVTPISIQVHGVATHEEDDIVIAAAVSGGAQFLVTGDADLLSLQQYGAVRIITARAFLSVLGVAVSEREGG